MRPLLPLAAVLLVSAAAPARAQSRAGVVEAAPSVPAGPGGPLSSTLSPGGVPQLVTLNLAAPTLTPAALAAAPLPAAYASLQPLPALPKAAAAVAAAEALPAAPALAAAPLPAEARGGPRAMAALAGHEEPAKYDATSLPDLIDATKRLFGESSPGRQSADYLKPGAPFDFGAAETFRYRTALGAYGSKTEDAGIAALVDSALGLARSAGIDVELASREGRDGVARPVMRVKPSRSGHRLNRLAWDLLQNYDSAVEYAPHRTSGGIAAYNSAEKVLFLPDFGRDDAFEAILHEARHAAFAKRLRAGDLSAYHAALIAYKDRSIAPDAMSYDSYMSLEELSTHVKTLLHALARAQRAGTAPARDAAVADARKYAFQLMDVLRSARINLFQLKRRLAAGELAPYAVTGPSWPEIPGGRWEAVNLPHAILIQPVLDEPAPARSLWNRLFKAAPQTPFEKAARRRVESLLPMIDAVDEELEPLLGALKDGAVDLKKARASASRMTGVAARADAAFAAP